MGRGWSRKVWKDPPDTGNTPGANPLTEMWLLTDLPAFTGLHSGVAPKRGPQPRTPLPSSPWLPFCPSLSASVSLARRRAPTGAVPVKMGGWLGQLAAPPPGTSKTHWAGQLAPHRRPPTAPSPAPTSGAAESCLGKRLPPARAAPGSRRPPRMTHFSRRLMPAGKHSRENGGHRCSQPRPGLPSLSPGTRFPRELRVSSLEPAGITGRRAAARSPRRGWGLLLGVGETAQPREPRHGDVGWLVALPNFTAIPGDVHRKSRPHFKHPREALVEGLGLARTRQGTCRGQACKGTQGARGHTRSQLGSALLAQWGETPHRSVTTLPGKKTQKLDQKLLLGKFESGPELGHMVTAATTCCPSSPALLRAP